MFSTVDNTCTYPHTYMCTYTYLKIHTVNYINKSRYGVDGYIDEVNKHKRCINAEAHI